MPRNSSVVPIVFPPTAPSAVATTGPAPWFSGLAVAAPAPVPAAVDVAAKAPRAITPAASRARADLVVLIRNIRISVLGGQSFLRSDERADAGGGAADDEGVDLPGALVGVDRLGVGDEPAHLVLQQDAVAAEQLAGITNRLAHPHRAERLGQRRVVVFRGAFLLELGEPGAQACGRGHVGEHADQQVLHELEAGDGPAELLALARVGEGVLVGAAGAADRLPGHTCPGPRRGQATGHAGAHVGLGQAERPYLLHPRHGRQPALFLFFGPAQVDRAHRQPRVAAG